MEERAGPTSSLTHARETQVQSAVHIPNLQEARAARISDAATEGEEWTESDRAKRKKSAKTAI